MQPNLGEVARLIGDPVRSQMLFWLLGGPERSASELALHANASPQSASMHLAKLVDAGLVLARSEGRHRFFRLATPQIASALEVIAAIAPAPQVNSLSSHNAMQRLREARTCYDHLAGRLGVRVSDALIQKTALRLRNDEYAVTRRGAAFFAELGIDVDAARAKRRQFARPCLDWTERRHHLAGALGCVLLETFLTKRWVARNAGDRSLTITESGQREFTRWF